MWLEAHGKMAGGARQNGWRRTIKCPEAHSLMSYVNDPYILPEESFFISDISIVRGPAH